MQAGTVVGNLAGVVAVRPEEADVVAELKAGSEEAFAWLISTYHQPIYSVIARMLQNPADAADVTQDVFIKVFRGISGFHGESSLRTWMYRIALHEASNQRRWWSRHCRQEVTIETETGHSSDGQPLCIKDTLVDAQHGGIIGVSARKFSDEDMVIGDREVRATRYTFITPYLAGSIWYDEENLWVSGEFERDGSKIQYQLDT